MDFSQIAITSLITVVIIIHKLSITRYEFPSIFYFHFVFMFIMHRYHGLRRHLGGQAIVTQIFFNRSKIILPIYSTGQRAPLTTFEVFICAWKRSLAFQIVSIHSTVIFSREFFSSRERITDKCRETFITLPAKVCP